MGGRFANVWIEVIWNILGAAIMLVMIPMVFTVLRPPRLDDPQKAAARAILAFPMVLAPAGLAFRFVILHARALAALFGPDALTMEGN